MLHNSALATRVTGFARQENASGNSDLSLANIRPGKLEDINRVKTATGTGNQPRVTGLVGEAY
jgi:hypothetical protein